MADHNRDYRISTEAVIALFLRVGIGILFFFAGLNKFLREGGAMGVADSIIERFADTFLPSLLLVPYAYALPYAEIAVGVLLILGLFSRPAILFACALLVSLAFGLFVDQNGDSAAMVLNYLLIAAVALWCISRDNRYSLDTFRQRR
jgi:thiosulfate dehydrogenase [quinone] large subunit